MERSAWTDERLDDRFDHIDSELRDLRAEMRRGFAELGGRLDAQSSELRGEIAALRGGQDTQGSSLRGEIAEVGSSLRGEIAEVGSSLRGEVADLRSTMLRLYGGNLIAMFGLIAAILVRGV